MTALLNIFNLFALKGCSSVVYTDGFWKNAQLKNCIAATVTVLTELARSDVIS